MIFSRRARCVLRSACHSSLNHGVKRLRCLREFASSAAGAIQRQFAISVVLITGLRPSLPRRPSTFVFGAGVAERRDVFELVDEAKIGA